MATDRILQTKRSHNFVDITGKSFGRLTVSSFHGIHSKSGQSLWLCRCSCGKDVLVRIWQLKGGGTSSCGCLRRELMRERRVVHGMSETSTYKAWINMIHRCTNPKVSAYQNYGGRGITVCDRWQKFENFLEDMGEVPKGLTLDRKDNSKGYYKDNCHYVGTKEQAKNRRVTVYLTHNGETKPLTEWCEQLGLAYGCVRSRYDKKWSSDRILYQGHYKTGTKLVRSRSEEAG